MTVLTKKRLLDGLILAAHFWPTDRVRKNFIFSKEASTYIEVIYHLGQNSNRRKISYECSKLAQKSQNLGQKSEIFEFSKNLFWFPPIAHRDPQIEIK